MLSVQHFLFQEREFKVYGTNENPLFLVNDIVCELLGLDKINSDRFFRDNKGNDRYVMRCQIDTSSPEL